MTDNIVKVEFRKAQPEIASNSRYPMRPWDHPALVASRKKFEAENDWLMRKLYGLPPRPVFHPALQIVAASLRKMFAPRLPH